MKGTYSQEEREQQRENTSSTNEDVYESIDLNMSLLWSNESAV